MSAMSYSPGNMLTLVRQGITAEEKEQLATRPTSDQITLLLKNHKQTVLLSVIPTTPFPEIKSSLLAALKSRDITTIDDTPVPSEPEEIEFGVLKNKKDPTEGWVPLEIGEMDVADAKGAKKNLGGKKSVLNESPAGASLGDGSMLAFRFRSIQKSVEPEEGGDAVVDMELEPYPGWNVILPSYDDEVE